MKAEPCPCHVCKPKKLREPGTPFGTDGHGEWRAASSYFGQYAEERWERALERRRKRVQDEALDELNTALERPDDYSTSFP